MTEKHPDDLFLAAHGATTEIRVVRRAILGAEEIGAEEIPGGVSLAVAQTVLSSHSVGTTRLCGTGTP